MSECELNELLSIAKKAAVLSGKFLIKGSSASRKVNKDLTHDVKIEADIQSEKIILDFLHRHSDFSVLSEECGLINGAGTGYVWIVDPVDGSLNYSRELPLCCVSIGLWKEESPILGVVYDFNRKELFSGMVGMGAWLNDKPIKVSNVDLKQKAILLTGLPVHTDFSSTSVQSFIEYFQSYKKARLLGSAALSIAYVACGRADVYSEKDIMLWDIAGGIPLVLGAGGDIRIEKTTKPNCLNVRVTNNHVG